MLMGDPIAYVIDHTLIPGLATKLEIIGLDGAVTVSVKPAGAFTVSLTDVPADVQAEVSAYFVSSGSSSMGSSLGNATGAAKGSPVSISGTLPSAGSSRIESEGRAEIVKGAVNPPPGFVQKYSLLVN